MLLEKAEDRLNAEYDGDFTFHLKYSRKRHIEAEVTDNVPSIVSEGRPTKPFALFVVPISRNPGIDEVVRRVNGGFASYLSISSREIVREGASPRGTEAS
jgi:hypothetical protein